jgi:hypothetical protein
LRFRQAASSCLIRWPGLYFRDFSRLEKMILSLARSIADLSNTIAAAKDRGGG